MTIGRQLKLSSFEDLLKKDGSVTVHHRNIQTLAVEMFKVKNNLSPKIIQDLFNLARSELFGIRFRLPGSLSRWVAGYEILAFEKPCLHYHKISTECQTNIHME